MTLPLKMDLAFIEGKEASNLFSSFAVRSFGKQKSKIIPIAMKVVKSKKLVIGALFLAMIRT
jgi:hypothetical protein